MQIREIPAQRKFVSEGCHDHKIEKIVNMNADISETIEDRELGFQIYISYPCTQCHAHFNAHKPPKYVAPTISMLEKMLTKLYLSRQHLSIDPKKFATPTLTPITPKSV